MFKHIVHAVRLIRHAIRDHGCQKRSSGWPHVEREFLKTNYLCAACGGMERLQVHHKKPFHLHPELELDEKNLIVLCMGMGRDCHLLIGHGDDFKAFNPGVLEDIDKARALHLANDDADLKVLVETIRENRKYEG
jgi:hypothetical protein